jgi:GST-like protein
LPDISAFPITHRWPPRNPDAIQLYSFPTSNGVKISIALEELGLPYDAHTVVLSEGDQKTREFHSLNPNNKIPAIIDPDGPGGRPLGMFESGAILIYLAEKTGRLMPTEPVGRYEVLQWLMFQMGGVGPMIGQFSYFFHGAGKEIEDRRPVERYIAEAKRLLRVLDERLEGREWVTDAYSIADIAIAPWCRSLRDVQKAGHVVDWDELDNVPAWLDRFLARPAVRRGLVQPPRE